MSENYSSLAWAMIQMWNSHFSKTIYSREDGTDVKFNIVHLFNAFSPANRNPNKILNIKEFRNPTNNIVVSSLDGVKIAASIWLNDKPSNKWVIICHGFNSDRFNSLYLGWHYRQLGYNILTFDFRNHGASETDVVTWGYREKNDLKSIILWLKENYKIEEIGLVGTSMGAFTANYFVLSETELVREMNIAWVISDSAYMSIKELLTQMIENNSSKLFVDYSREIFNDILKIYQNEFNVYLDHLDFFSLIQEDVYYPPIMFIHNRNDRVTSYLDSIRMHDIKNNLEKSDRNELLIFDEGYHHTKSLIEFEDEYIKNTLDFVKKHKRG